MATASSDIDMCYDTVVTESETSSLAIESGINSAALPSQVLTKFGNKRIHYDEFSESPAQFLWRLPPSTTTVDQVGDWIWVYNPHFDQSSLQLPDVNTFIIKGDKLLRNFDTYKEDVQMGDGKGHDKKVMIKKRLEELPSAIKDIATECSVTHGKWMLFPIVSNVDKVWLKVVQGVVEGKLGTSAKVAPARLGDNRSRLIAIYTKDFSDREDVKRVLLELKDRDLVGIDKAPIFYKADAWTYLGIESKNNYGLRASLYSAKDFL